MFRFPIHVISQLKLDGVAPLITHPPPTSFTILSKKNVTWSTWHVTCDRWYVTGDVLHVRRDKWHVACDRWREVNILSKFLLPSCNGLRMKFCWIFWGKGWLTDLINQWVTKVLVEQPRLQRVYANKTKILPCHAAWTHCSVHSVQCWAV